MWSDIDTDHDGKISLHELQACMADADSVMNRLLEQVALPRGFNATELFHMLDENGDAYLEHEEFVESFYRLIDGGAFQRMCVVQMGINQTKALTKRNQERLHRIEDSVANILREIRGAESPLHSHEHSHEFVGRPSVHSCPSLISSGGFVRQVSDPGSRAVHAAALVPFQAVELASHVATGPLHELRSPLARALPQVAVHDVAAVRTACAGASSDALAAMLEEADCDARVCVTGDMRRLLLAGLQALQSVSTSLRDLPDGDGRTGLDAATPPSRSSEPLLPPLDAAAEQQAPLGKKGARSHGQSASLDRPSINDRLMFAFDATVKSAGLEVQWNNDLKMKL